MFMNINYPISNNYFIYWIIGLWADGLDNLIVSTEADNEDENVWLEQSIFTKLASKNALDKPYSLLLQPEIRIPLPLSVLGYGTTRKGHYYS